MLAWEMHLQTIHIRMAIVHFEMEESPTGLSSRDIARINVELNFVIAQLHGSAIVTFVDVLCHILESCK